MRDSQNGKNFMHGCHCLWQWVTGLDSLDRTREDLHVSEYDQKQSACWTSSWWINTETKLLQNFHLSPEFGLNIGQLPLLLQFFRNKQDPLFKPTAGAILHFYAVVARNISSGIVYLGSEVFSRCEFLPTQGEAWALKCCQCTENNILVKTHRLQDRGRNWK